MAKVYDNHGKAPTSSHNHGQAQSGHGEENHGHTSTGLYWLIGITLAIVTAIEVLWPLLGLNDIGLIGGLVGLMLLKGAMVIMYFMHLKGDFSIFKFVFFAPLGIAVFFIVAFLLLFAGSHAGIAG